MDKSVICKIGVTKKGKVPFWYKDEDEQYVYSLFDMTVLINHFIEDYATTPEISTHSSCLNENIFPELIYRSSIIETGIRIIKVTQMYIYPAYEASKYPHYNSRFHYTKPVKKTR